MSVLVIGGTGFIGWRIRLEPARPVPTPAVAGGRVFFGAGFGSFDFFAFDALTGRVLWKTVGDRPPADAKDAAGENDVAKERDGAEDLARGSLP